jgi:hypothetical protein
VTGPCYNWKANRLARTAARMRRENQQVEVLRENGRLQWLHKTLSELIVMGALEVEYDDDKGTARFSARQEAR